MYKDVFSALDPNEFAELARLLVKVLGHARPSALEYYADLARHDRGKNRRSATKS